MAVGDLDLGDSPAGQGGEHNHLEGPPRPAISDVEVQQVEAAGRTHGSEVPQGQVQRSAESSGEVSIRQPGMGGPGASRRDAGAEDQIGAVLDDGFDDADEVSRVERPVGVHEAHDVGVGGLEAGPAGLAEPASGLDNDSRTEVSGDRGRTVSAAVVDDDRAEPLRQRADEGGERRGLVEDGKDDIGHGGGRYHQAGEGSEVAFVGQRWSALLGASAALAVAFGLAAFVGFRVLDPLTFINAPPFYGKWERAIGWTVTAPVAVALAVIWGARHRHRHLVPWRWLLLGAVIAAMAWSISLGLADNVARLTEQLRGKPDYARGLGAIGDHPGNYLATFNERARGPSATVISRGYPVHVQGHPPGAVVSLWALTKLGLDPIAGGVVLVWAGLAAGIVGVLSSVRRLAGEATARAATPFVVLLPGAVWSHTFDTYFAGIGALAVMASVFALVPRSGNAEPDSVVRFEGASLRWALVSGVLFGYLALLSYGLVLLGLVPVVVALGRRRFWPLPVTGLTSFATMALPGAWGWNWFGGLATTHHQYVTTVASIRPFGYFLAGNLVTAACAVGPAVLAGFILVLRSPSRARTGRWGGAGPLIIGAGGALLLADVSGLAKAEVERIFQPFYGWLALAGVGISAPIGNVRHDRVETAALVVQAAVAIALATQLRSPW